MQNEKIRGIGRRILGTYYISSVVAEGCTFENCDFGYNRAAFSEKRDSVQDCEFANCRVSKCLVGTAIIRTSKISNLSNDMLMCWGTLFDQVTLEGKIGPMILHGIASASSSQSLRQKHRAFADHFYEDVEFALDISNAQFSDFSIRTGAIPLSLVRLDANSQFIISRPDQPLTDEWIDTLAVSQYTKMIMKLMNDDAEDESLLVAPKLDSKLYKQVLLDAEILAREGLLRFENTQQPRP